MDTFFNLCHEIVPERTLRIPPDPTSTAKGLIFHLPLQPSSPIRILRLTLTIGDCPPYRSPSTIPGSRGQGRQGQRRVGCRRRLGQSAETTKFWSVVSQRVLGHVFHSPPLSVGSGPKLFTEDLALIELPPRRSTGIASRAMWLISVHFDLFQ